MKNKHPPPKGEAPAQRQPGQGNVKPSASINTSKDLKSQEETGKKVFCNGPASNQCSGGKNKHANRYLTFGTTLNYDQYIKDAYKTPLPGKGEELNLIRAWKERGDTFARDSIIKAHERLIFSMADERCFGARKQRGEYTDRWTGLVTEGRMGAMKALEIFDEKEGKRFSQKARPWINKYQAKYAFCEATDSEYTPAAEAVFSNLSRIKYEMGISGSLRTNAQLQEAAKRIAARRKGIHIDPEMVASMDAVLTGQKLSLDTPITVGDGKDKSGASFVDLLGTRNLPIYADDYAPEKPTQEQTISWDKEFPDLKAAMDCLDQREQRILIAHNFETPKMTLEKLGEEFNITGERVRQIEADAIEKIKKAYSPDKDATEYQQEHLPSSKSFREVQLNEPPPLAPIKQSRKKMKAQPGYAKKREVFLRTDGVESATKAFTKNEPILAFDGADEEEKTGVNFVKYLEDKEWEKKKNKAQKYWRVFRTRKEMVRQNRPYYLARPKGKNKEKK